MATVNTKKTADGPAVAVDDEIVHVAASTEAAQQLADWVRWQLEAGTSLKDVRKMLGGQPTRGGAVTGGVEASGPDLSAVNGTVSALKSSLDAGELDDRLEALLQAEIDGKDRKSAISAIEDRIEETG